MNGVNQHTMKWHNAKIILFIIGALANFGTGGQHISGNIYNTSSLEFNPEMIYSTYGSALKSIDVIYGITLVILAIIQIYICISLKKMKRNSPAMFTRVYSIGIGVNLMYNISSALIIGVYTNIVSSIFATIMCSMFAWLDHTYYKKREYMFRN